ncbi:MAG: sigma-70 family RNA polymerase sigma factor [Bacteroidales bacterium]|jgi:RNA polymerase sigma-70 factor (ECF subfamily)|nr:sigma-70 family RNA polymerase sigma factor [Bacteroidales bacterium]MBO7346655.1 sigma-70 family RNA polymerase sigma factor [Bacteroidales bacterium]MBQ4477882.1 sigma-70 family RNA polymerase sigma factor [Bacteroidales bacterium]MBR4454106.1 sigma-70 family RNA polymerase sigma factor [Bacteroidales bacterium]MCR5554622.1 sigma-70 family RNA polymerase sigma factor [Bacteroidales bacterium]
MELNDTFTTKSQRDYILVRSAIEDGNQQAYAELMQNYRDSLYMLMYKMVNDPYEAEDLTIEAFGKAFCNLNQYTCEYAFSTWLFKIASNNCIDFLRKKKVQYLMIDARNADDDNSAPFELPDDKSTPEEQLFDKEKVVQVRNFVNQLKPHYRQLIELRFYEELSYEEISERLGMPLGTVKAKLFRAKSMLQAIMEGKVI